VVGFIACSVDWTHKDMGGWKWMPLGAGSQWPAAGVLGGCPKARE
jgi:hypothetical protein